MTRVAVVGGGGAGSACAWWLARRGADVTVYEQFEPGHRRGSSHGRSRIFRLAYPHPHYVAMAEEALGLWRELEEDSGDQLLTVTGGIDHGDPATVGTIATALERRGVAHEWLSPEEAGGRWPGMRFASRVLFQPDAGRIDADATVAAFQRRAAELGADLRFGERVESLAEIDADVVVVTAGSWLPKLLAPPVPLKVTQEQVFHFEPRSPGGWPSFIHHRDRTIYGLEAPGEGVKVAEHHTGKEVDPDERDFVVDDDVRRRVVAHVEQWFPGLDPSPRNEVTCLYTSTPTEEFVLERRDRVVVGSACSGHGFKFMPLTGRILADLAMA